MTGTLEHLDPTTLHLADNVRDDAALDANFLASVAEHGVLQPVTAVRAADDRIEVRDGQRRTLAARHAGLSTIPVYVLDATGTDTAARITHQMVTNDHRTPLTDAQRATGITQMLLSGVSVAKVAKALSMGRDTVTAARTATASTAARTALQAGQLSLTEAAALAEFDDDPAAVQRLLEAAGQSTFDHRVAQVRQDRESARARAVAEKCYADAGFAIFPEHPEWRDTNRVLLRHLRTADGRQVTTDAVTDPVRWAVVLVENAVLVDATTGETVDHAEVDWTTQRHPDRDAAAGTRHARSVVEQTVWEPDYYCLDPAGCGLTLAEFLLRQRSGSHAGPDHTDGDADAARAERRKVLTLNKLGLAAQEVRRAFVRDTLVSRNTPPKGSAVFVAGCLERGPGLLAEHGGRQLLGELLGLCGATVRDAVDQLTGDARAQVLLLAMVLAALEGRTPKDAWRCTAGQYTPAPGPADYLRFLAGHGYPLSDVERIVTGERTADDVHRDATATD
ncbi:nuclease [Mycolicibacterium sp. P1-18]|uniref:ParB/RepB/Spo0J family partition protein n=1 Tax=Mycolicibacterium sp. P1-18 TaxID=2024615 RepID=UPI0011F2D69A|nr:ParB N-terminal domain-containing protein [Mycolicibacterium sp. P1-18]KAA0093578.1 nuclease [Mycolicibacterium sp. P1-18]